MPEKESVMRESLSVMPEKNFVMRERVFVMREKRSVVPGQGFVMPECVCAPQERVLIATTHDWESFTEPHSPHDR